MTWQVLVVEDDEAYRRLVVRMLGSAGFGVLTADGFAAATTIIEGDQPIDLLLVDIGMPGGTPHGASIARFAQMKRKSLKVLFMTGGRDLEKFALYGNDEPVLYKPFTREQLAAAVTAALE